MAADPNRHYATGRRSPVHNPARASLPITTTTTGGFTSAYGDIHVLPASRHDSLVRPTGEYRSAAGPITTTTTTYMVRKDPIHRTTSLRESSQTRARRSSTMGSESRRPPVIVTTTRHGSSQASSGDRAESPSRGDPYRSSDEGAYYTQPASSIPRARASSRTPVPYSATMDNEEWQRLRDRTGEDRLHSRSVDPYRAATRGSVYHQHGPPQRRESIDYGPDSYEYTNPGELVRHDLDNTRPRHKRRESYDQYYRPSVSVTTDIGRPLDQGERRPRGPPPTSRQLDRLNRNAAAGIYDQPSIRMPLPPVVPLAPEPARGGSDHLVVPPSPSSGRRRSSSHSRPVSMISDGRYGHPDDYYHGRQDEMVQREIRDRDHDYFKDDTIAARGFGLRIDPKEPEEPRRAPDTRHRDERRERREARKELEEREPRRRSDEDLEPAKKDERRDSDDRDRKAARAHKHEGDHGHERKESKTKEPEDDDKKDSTKDKLATGLSMAAATIGLGAVLKSKDKDESEPKEDRSPPRRHKDKDEDVDDRRRSDDVERRYRVHRKDDDRRPYRDEHELEVVEPQRERERPRRREALPEAESDLRERNRRDAEAKLNGEPTPVPVSSASERDTPSSQGSVEESKPKPRIVRRRRASSAFNPNDTAGLMALKAQMAENESREKSPDTKAPDNKIPVIKEPSPERADRNTSPESKAASEADTALSGTKDDSRGRELVLPERDEKQVRLVSPPRDKDEKKPIKGILKQPKAQFPEEPNPVREGVAPHKDDKKKASVPAGARWTKINRRLVNPEALTIGKERFEVRDDFVIVLRVLNKEEIEAYTAATAQLRGGLQCLSCLCLVCPPHLPCPDTRPFDRASTFDLRPSDTTRPSRLRAVPVRACPP
ncbi:hypothetical protein GQ53DRAFT_336404 [Thozetella sp. PMI_491]|nr:hypothetical protein GQ53DRAFT_336404 [Thozetella sp. PMI_491]